MRHPREPKEREIDHAAISERAEVLEAERDSLATALEDLVRACRGKPVMEPAVARAHALLALLVSRRKQASPEPGGKTS